MLRFMARLFIAAVAGGALYLTFEPIGLWWLGPAGIAGLAAALAPWGGVSPHRKQGALIAFVHSMTTFLLLLPWIGELVGPVPYVALSLTLSLWSLVLGFFGVRVIASTWGLIAFPLLFTTIEFFRSIFPFGGFPWPRIAWGQVSGPLATLAALGGPALVSLAVSVVGVALWLLLSNTRRTGVESLTACATVALLVVVANTQVDQSSRVTGTAKVTAIQGNVPRLGLDFNAQRRAVLSNHVQVTHEAAHKHKDLDLVVWPENSSDVNPFKDGQARALITSAVEAVNAPVVVGTLTEDEVGDRNTMQVFNADGSKGEHHYKKYLQPFGETMPFRNILKHVSDYVELAGDMKAGNGPGVVDMQGIALGIATCYEVAFDNAYRDSIKNGAQILATPTNNATFGFSDMTYQQLAMSRLRAIETDRAVVVAATSGVSAIVAPDGEVLQQSEIFVPAALVADLELKTGITPAVRWGRILELILILLGMCLTLWCQRVAGITKRSVRNQMGVQYEDYER